jgi:hypothetical protein
LVLWLQKSVAIADELERLKLTEGDGTSVPESLAILLVVAASTVRRGNEGMAAGLAASLDIAFGWWLLR